MNKVIVTGANGFLGRYLVDELLTRGYEIWAVVRENRNTDNIKAQHIVTCDLKDILHLNTVIPAGDYNAFYHLAWCGSSGNARKDYELQLKNAKGCVDAAVISSKLGCRRFVGAGSVTELLYERYMQQDNSKPEPVACYTVGKIAAEYMTKCVCIEQNIDFLWGHITNFYGIGDMSKNFINFLIRSYKSGIVPELTAGEQKADFLYVSDVAKALVGMAEKGNTGCAYYIGYGEPMPLKDFVIRIRDEVNPRLQSGLGKKVFRGMDVDFEKIDIHKLYQETGFVPEVSFDDGIRRTIEWIQSENENIMY